MIYLSSHWEDPALNLALEQYVFDETDRSNAYFMLWQNRKAVIIGRYQNTLAEINPAFIQEHGIKVVRRLSGGGAVYHDGGNLNFTFVAPQERAEELNLRMFCQPVVRALGRLGVEAEINGRNDITVDGKKFSGNAQYCRQGRVMHHGTILFDSDLAMVAGALRAPDSKLKSKGIKSVRSRVTNLRDYLPPEVTLEDFRACLLEEVFGGGEIPRHTFTQAELDRAGELSRRRYETWEWNYGVSPPCSIQKEGRFERCGTVQVQMEIREGRISCLRFYGDFFSVDDPALLARVLIGRRLDSEDLAQALSGLEVGRYLVGLTAGELVELLTA